MIKDRIANKDVHISAKEYVLMYFFICICGNPAFTASDVFGSYLYVLFLGVVYLSWYKNIDTKHFYHACYKWGGVLSIVFLVQFFSLGMISVLACLNHIVKFFIAILIASIFQEKLPVVYLKVISFIALVSFFFYAFNLIGIQFPALIKTHSTIDSLIVFSQPNSRFFAEEFDRNTGFFWEPGAFAGYLLFALLLWINDLKLLWTKYRKHFIIITIALITTQSTTGILGYGILILFYLLQTVKNKFALSIVLGILAVFFLIIYSHVDFLGGKINKELEQTAELSAEDAAHSRTGSIIFDLQYIKAKPLFGNGFDATTRYRFHLDYFDYEDLVGFGNGFSGYLATMGFVFFMFFFYKIYKNPYLQRKIPLIIMVVLLLQGEQFLNFPAFMMLPFAHFIKVHTPC